MSNPERDPDEVTCAATVTTDVEIMRPRDVPLGGPRAMTVRRTLPLRERSLIDAWCFVDHYGPDEVNLMSAGHGISHSEVSTPATTTLHGAQLWVALPDAAPDAAPGFAHHAPTPVTGEGWRPRPTTPSTSLPVATRSG